MNESELPDLTFPVVKYGKRETPWNLKTLLYYGGAGTNLGQVGEQIAKNILGAPLFERLPLVSKLHEVFAGNLAGGGSRFTAQGELDCVRQFFSWAESEGRQLTIETVEDSYIEWTDHLLHRQKIVGDIGEISVRNHSVKVGRILTEALGLKRGLIDKTRIPKQPRKRRVLGTQADKQNLMETVEFGCTLLDITNALSVEAIRGPLPCSITFRTGKIIYEWTRLKPPEKVKALVGKSEYARSIVEKTRDAWVADTSLRTRFPLVNLRIIAEMLLFISQTGMNLSQVHRLKMCKFRYKSHLDGYQIYRVYKGRRQGEVAFEIFSEYKEIFERYLTWRAEIFPDDDDGLLFPFVSERGRAADVPPTMDKIRRLCKQLGVRYFPPGALRKTRINWLLRRSNDPAMIAEMHAHMQETLIQNYQQPHLQVAMIEISRFHSCADPAIAPPGPGVCIEAVPKAISGASPDAPVPDCKTPAGCLFCEHQRDIDSEDHVWSLSSYRHFKSLELASYRLPDNGKVPSSTVATMERVTAKLKYFKESSEIRALWVGEAIARINEGDYHPRWDGFIQLMEARVWQ